MGSAALKGAFEDKYIKLGGYRFFVGPYGTSIDESASFDTENPPLPFRDLGLASNESGMKLGVNMFDLKAGIPSIRKKKWIIERDVEIDVTLHEFSPPNLGRAIWNNLAGKKTFAASPAIQQLTAPIALATQKTVDVVDGTLWTIDQYVALESASADLPLSQNEYLIKSIAGNTLTLDREIGSVFGGVAPYIGQAVSWKIPFGNGKTSKVSLVAVFDDLENGQFLVVAPAVTIKGDFNQSLQANAENLKFIMTAMADKFTLNLVEDATQQSVAAAPAPTAQVFTVDDGSVFAPGDKLIIDATADLLETSENMGTIDTVVTNEITLVDPLPMAPSSGWQLKRASDSLYALVAMLHFQQRS